MSDKSRGGRRQIPIRKTTAVRIRQLRIERRETQGDIANVASCTALTVGRWENETRGVEDAVLELLAKHWGVLPAYLRGETDIKDDPVAFRLEQEQKILDGFTAAVNENEYRIRRARLENLFNLCGFQYQDLFDGQLLHILTDENGFISPAAFNDTEMDALLSKIHDLIELECYRRSATQKE